MNKMGHCALLLLGMCLAACLTPALSLQCYINGPPGGVFAYDITPTMEPNATCVSYKLGRLECAAQPDCKDNWKWVYSVTTLRDCAKLKTYPAVYKNVQCCTKDKCNAPNPTLDDTTKILPMPPGLQVSSGRP